MHIGERVAAYRKRRGMSQQVLADFLGLSRSWVSQVERGLREVDKVTTLERLSDVLHVEVGKLLGSQRLGKYELDEQPAVVAIRARMAGYANLLGEQAAVWPLPQLRNATVEVHRAYQAARYEAAAGMVPDLLEAADAYNGYEGQQGREIHIARCWAYVAAAKLLNKMGEGHLGWLASERATHAAMATGAPEARGLAAHQVGVALLSSGRTSEAEHVAVGTAERMRRESSPNSPGELSLEGALWLLGSVAASRRGDRREARERLETADHLAQRLGHDGNHAWTAFGPTNVMIHRATTAADLGDPYDVLRYATEIDTETMPEGLNGRRSRVHLDVAWAQARSRNDLESILHLQQAEKIAPNSLQYYAVAQNLVRDLLKRTRRPTSALTMLAGQAGVL